MIPNLTVPDEGEVILGRYALMRRSYLMNHRKGLFTVLLMSMKLNPHLMEIEQTAMERLERQTRQMAQTEGVTEELKASDPMAWIQRVTNIRNLAEESILSDLIYS